MTKESNYSIKKHTLSKREFQVLELIKEGYSRKEIIEMLHVTEATIKAHRHAILTKLGVENMMQAIVLCLKNGVISLDATPEHEWHPYMLGYNQCLKDMNLFIKSAESGCINAN